MEYQKKFRHCYIRVYNGNQWFRFSLFPSMLVVVSLLIIGGCGTTKKITDKYNRGDGLDLYLLIGQSNMAGRASMASVQDTLKNVYIFDGLSWQPAANPLNKYSTVRKPIGMQKLGPGYAFARKLQKCTGRAIGLVVNARGGTKIEWWQKGYVGPHDDSLYEKAVIEMRKALPYGHLKGIIWHQGEGNQHNPEDYMALLKTLVKDLRMDLDAKDVYFVAGELGKWRSSSIRMNQVISSISSTIKQSGYVSTDGLTPLKGDSTNPHFDARSQLILGDRYADQVLKRVYGRRPCKQ